jgi:hypothetical protein
MALETSHLTSMAVRTQWLKYVMVNLVNVIMFTTLIVSNFDTGSASFWQNGQVASIYASATVSLIVYHYMLE